MIIIFNLHPTGPCDERDCDAGYECLIYEPTNEAYCSPNCDDLNPCDDTEDCLVEEVLCAKDPCPGVLSCIGRCTRYCVPSEGTDDLTWQYIYVAVGLAFILMVWYFI